jgi:fido (protein-threonine AMPylation protein)
MASPQLTTDILDFLTARAGAGAARAADITQQVQGKRPTVNRRLALLLSQGAIVQEGAGPTTAYRLASSVTPAAPEACQTPAAYHVTQALPWSTQALQLRACLNAPIGTRTPVTYQRQFVDGYVPNQSSLLPTHLAQALFNAGRTQGQQPASTYARKVLEPLLIDLSWHSSRLEGNRKSLLDTQALFVKGRSASDDGDATMLLNHKDAIEFMVDAAPEYGVTVPVVRNIQSLLMQGLLDNPDAMGAIRQTVVNITDSVYVPTQMPSLLEEMLGLVVEKARLIKNPVEAAFFLWLQVAYLQPFEDGNKRTSRLCANLPLMLSNCAPLSFLDVERGDYALAVMGVYERLDVTLAVELFEWTYRRSIEKYQVMLTAMGSPDPFRAQYRAHLGEAIRKVVNERVTLALALGDLSLPAADQAPFLAILRRELQALETFNCARFRLSLRKTDDWIQQGRPL